MRISFSLLTVMALMPQSLYAQGKITQHWPFNAGDIYRKIPENHNPFKGESANRIIENYSKKRASQLVNGFSKFIKKVGDEWGWLKAIYGLQSFSKDYITGDGINSFRSEAEEHILGLARDEVPDAYEGDAAEMFWEAFGEMMDLVMLAGRRSLQSAITTDDIHFAGQKYWKNCWPLRKYRSTNGKITTVFDSCKIGYSCGTKIVTKLNENGVIQHWVLGGFCYKMPKPECTTKPNCVYPNCNPYNSFNYCEKIIFPPNSYKQWGVAAGHLAFS